MSTGDAGRVVRPYYLVIDVSSSMTHSRRGPASETVVQELLNVLEERDDVDNPVMLCVAEFADQVRVLARLARLAALVRLPGVSTGGGTTSFEAVFRFLHQQITTDVRALRAENLTASRPVVLLVTDGEVADEWESSFVQLTEYDPASGEGFPWYPFIVPVGLFVHDSRELAGLAFPPGMVPVVELMADAMPGEVPAALEAVPHVVLAASPELAAAETVLLSVDAAPPDHDFA